MQRRKIKGTNGSQEPFTGKVAIKPMCAQRVSYIIYKTHVVHQMDFFATKCVEITEEMQ